MKSWREGGRWRGRRGKREKEGREGDRERREEVEVRREGGRERERPFTNQAAHHLYKCYIAADIKSPHPSMYTVHISSVE